MWAIAQKQGGKNKVAPPFRVAEFDILYEGISYEADVLTTAIKYGVVKKLGASYSFNEKLGVGLIILIEIKGKKLLDAIKEDNS